MKLSYYLLFVFVSVSLTMTAQHQRPFQIYKENGKFGIKDAQNKVVVNPIYRDIKTSKFGVFAMQSIEQKWAIFNSEGVQISAFVYDRMEQNLPNIIEVRQGAKIGLVNEDGKQLIPVNYHKITPIGKVYLAQKTAVNNSMQPIAFEYRGAIVTKGNVTGFIDQNNKMILPMQYEKIKATANFELANGIIDIVGLIVVKNGQYGIVNQSGQSVIIAQYNYINALNRLGLGELQKNGKKGLYNKKLEIVIEPKFDEITILNDQLFAGKLNNIWTIYDSKKADKVYAEVDGIYPFANGFSRIKKGAKWSILSPDGNVLLPFEYSGVTPFGQNVLLEKEHQRFIYTSNGMVKPYNFLSVISWRNLNDKLKPAQTLEGKFGYINDNGTFVIDAIYDEAKDFDQGVAIVKKDNLYGFINEKGELIQPIAYQIPNLNQKPTTLLVQKKSLYGYMDYQGNQLIDCQYESIAPFGKFMRAKRNGKWGWIDQQEKAVIPFQFDFIENYEKGKERFRYQNDGKLGWINYQTTKNELQTLSEWADDIEISEADVRNVRVGNYFGLINQSNEFIIPVRYETKIVFDKFEKAVVKENGFWGMVDKGGNIVIPTIYQERFRFGKNQLACVLKNDKYGVVDYNGNIVIPTIYDSFIYTDYEYWTVKKNNKYGITDDKGQLIIPIEYEKVFPYINHLALAKKDGQWGYINELNQPIIPFEYQVLNSFIDGRAMAKKNNYWGMINPDNETILPFKYDNLVEEVNGFISANQQGFWGIINDRYKIIVPFKYDKITSLDNYFRVEKNNKVGLFTTDGQLILPTSYDALTIDENGFKIRKEDKYGLFDFDGNPLIPIIYDELMYFNNGISRVKKGDKYGMITAQGKMIISCDYGYLGLQFTDNYIEAMKNGRYGILNKNGKTVVKFQYERIRWKNETAEGLINGNWLKIKL